MKSTLIIANKKSKYKVVIPKYGKLIDVFAVVFLIFINGFILNAQQYAKLVDPEIGSQGSGLGSWFNYVGAAFPFGMFRFPPSFFSPQKGFVVNQYGGAGCPHVENFPVLLVSGNLTHSLKYTYIYENLFNP